MRRAGACAALGVALLLSACATAEPARPGLPDAIAVSFKRVALAPSDSTQTRVGQLIYRGGIEIASADARFGGWSGLTVSGDGTEMLSQSDEAHFLRAHLIYDAKGDLAGIDDAQLADMRGLDGQIIHDKEEGDAEGLAALTPAGPDGAVAVSFERDDRVWLYDLSHGLEATPAPFAMPGAVRSLPFNLGLESLTMFGAGNLLAVGEVPVPPKNEHPAWLVPYPGGTTSPDGQLWVKHHAPYEISDAAVGPDGDLYLLERHYFGPVRGIVAAVRRIPKDEVKPGAELDGAEIAEFTLHESIDNMEGLSLRRASDGKTFLYMISDDNYSALQRTLLLMFALP